jgi:hypothetical protein
MRIFCGLFTFLCNICVQKMCSRLKKKLILNEFQYLKIIIFLNVTPYSLVEVHRHFGVMLCLLLQCQSKSSKLDRGLLVDDLLFEN